MNKLTCVIPFLNEGIEVFRTVKSIRDTVGDSVNIILINDASDDGIDYKVVANEFNCKYVWNSKRLGVAGSRDMGVQLCETEMCLLLDSHMRFYDSDWLGVIVSEITSDPRRVYCTGCVPLWYPFDEKQSKETGLSTGAFLQTSFKDWHTSFEPKWLPLRLSGIEHIPLVLGATYCFTKDYYVELGGLSGLKSYGSDEAWISLKSWAIGNGCAVIGNVGIGHVFRDKHPYVAPKTDAVYNKLMVVSIICPDKKHWITELLSQGGPEVVKLLKDNWDEIVRMRSWFINVEKIGWRDNFNELNGEFTEDWEEL